MTAATVAVGLPELQAFDAAVVAAAAITTAAFVALPIAVPAFAVLPIAAAGVDVGSAVSALFNAVGYAVAVAVAADVGESILSGQPPWLLLDGRATAASSFAWIAVASVAIAADDAVFVLSSVVQSPAVVVVPTLFAAVAASVAKLVAVRPSNDSIGPHDEYLLPPSILHCWFHL